MAKRTQHVKVRLVPASGGSSTEVILHLEEKQAIEQACAKLTREQGVTWGVSTFLREVALFAAEVKRPQPSYLEVVIEAAAQVGMGPGEWMRTLALEAIGATDLTGQLARAKAGFVAGFPSP